MHTREYIRAVDRNPSDVAWLASTNGVLNYWQQETCPGHQWRKFGDDEYCTVCDCWRSELPPEVDNRKDDGTGPAVDASPGDIHFERTARRVQRTIGKPAKYRCTCWDCGLVFRWHRQRTVCDECRWLHTRKPGHNRARKKAKGCRRTLKSS